ncbi:hypothetical protein FB45DRAFT_889630 [Roridomyces roridus]|uniref:Uncharacterized protein n=1 Tax=Roridomyces roridus TaxID=1738132 RepID=A0AAD7CN57_9AGAR|nr:hypothetical protein FB45DRAFT_889630 [Roridomyces roridus]
MLAVLRIMVCSCPLPPWQAPFSPTSEFPIPSARAARSAPDSDETARARWLYIRSTCFFPPRPPPRPTIAGTVGDDGFALLPPFPFRLLQATLAIQIPIKADLESISTPSMTSRTFCSNPLATKEGSAEGGIGVETVSGSSSIQVLDTTRQDYGAEDQERSGWQIVYLKSSGWIAATESIAASEVVTNPYRWRAIQRVYVSNARW